MDEEKFKNSLKKTIIVIIVVLIFILIIGIYIFNSKKAQLSIYSNKEQGNMFQSIGMKEEEFKQYLSVFSLLVNEKYNQDGYDDKTLDNMRVLDTAISYIEEMSSYEVTQNNEGLQTYEANIINEIAKEIKGMYISNNIDAGNLYTYDETQNVYIKNESEYTTVYCTQIDEIEKKDGKIITTYKCIFPKDNELSEYQENNPIEIETYTIKATIVENTDYEYSKYFISSIEKISNENVKYNETK